MAQKLSLDMLPPELRNINTTHNATSPQAQQNTLPEGADYNAILGSRQTLSDADTALMQQHQQHQHGKPAPSR